MPVNEIGLILAAVAAAAALWALRPTRKQRAPAHVRHDRGRRAE